MARCYVAARIATAGESIGPKVHPGRGIRLALSIDGKDPDALAMLGRATASSSGDFDTAREMVDRAVVLNPNAAIAWEQRGWTYHIAGQPEEAIRSFERAIRLSPFDPWLFSTLAGMGTALIGLGRFDEAVVAAKNALQKNQTYGAALSLPRGSSGASRARCTRPGTEARKAVAQLLELEPHFRISDYLARSGHWWAQMLIDGLRKAGLPE